MFAESCCNYMACCCCAVGPEPCCSMLQPPPPSAPVPCRREAPAGGCLTELHPAACQSELCTVWQCLPPAPAASERPGPPFPLQEAALLGILSFLMSMVVLSFFARVLLDIVDAVFFCYAIDKDSHTVTREDVHEVFSQVQHVLHAYTCLQLCTAAHKACSWSRDSTYRSGTQDVSLLQHSSALQCSTVWRVSLQVHCAERCAGVPMAG